MRSISYIANCLQWNDVYYDILRVFNHTPTIENTNRIKASTIQYDPKRSISYNANCLQWNGVYNTILRVYHDTQTVESTNRINSSTIRYDQIRSMSYIANCLQWNGVYYDILRVYYDKQELKIRIESIHQRCSTIQYDCLFFPELTVCSQYFALEYFLHSLIYRAAVNMDFRAAPCNSIVDLKLVSY